MQGHHLFCLSLPQNSRNLQDSFTETNTRFPRRRDFPRIDRSVNHSGTDSQLGTREEAVLLLMILVFLCFISVPMETFFFFPPALIIFGLGLLSESVLKLSVFINDFINSIFFFSAHRSHRFFFVFFRIVGHDNLSKLQKTSCI